jgi:tripartite-type tricarboxylate transporter receptor subunit TctC
MVVKTSRVRPSGHERWLPDQLTATLLSRRTALLLLASTCGGRLVQAEPAWPVPVTRFIVPFAAGGALDVLCRLIADRLSRDLGVSFVVETRPGAGGAIGAQAVVRAPPDGSTLMFTSSSISILPALNPKLGFDPERELLPVSVVCDLPPLLLVPGTSRFTSLRDLLAEARSKPGSLNYGSGGLGSASHLAAALFVSMPGSASCISLTRGRGRPSTRFMAGRSTSSLRPPSMFSNTYAKGGCARSVLACRSGCPRSRTCRRSRSSFPAMPRRTGSRSLRRRVCRKTCARLVQALAAARESPEVRARFEAGAAVPRLDGPELLAKRMAEEVPRWKQLVEQLDIKPQ